MDELISRKDVTERMKGRAGCEKCENYGGVRCRACTWDYAMDCVDEVPAVPAVPAVNGRWEGDETCEAYDIAGFKTWAVKRKCSNCGFTHKFIEAHMCYGFCPNCGAKMDSGNEEECPDYEQNYTKYGAITVKED